MNNTTFSKFAIDNASILFLAQIRKDHTNSFRFSMTLTENISPETLQLAVDRVYRRFPTVIAGFYPGFFHYFQIPAKMPPQVMQDTGCLRTMTKKELRECAYRVLYKDKKVSIEAFHALTDGYGAIASFTTLVAEYLRLKHGITIPVTNTLLDLEHSPMLHELEDSFLDYDNDDPKRMPSRYAFQLPGGNQTRDSVKATSYVISTNRMLDCAHRYGVTINTLLSTVMASSVMDLQEQQDPKKMRPVRIMVPVNLRRIFPSRTLRNFSYYTLPTMEPHEKSKSISELLINFSKQIQEQIKENQMASIITNNVKLQNSWYFKMIPLTVKCWLMRFICNFFGEVTSSITVTNLGNVTLPESMQQFITHMDVTLTPRIRSPYGCAILSYNGQLSINVSRFPEKAELDQIFYSKLTKILEEETP